MALPIDPNEPYDDPQDPEEVVLEAAARLEVPEGYRVEVIEGRIIVTPPADCRHAFALDDLGDALKAAGARDKGLRVLTSGLGLYLRPGKKGFVIPDLAVVDENIADHELPHKCYPPDMFKLVAEVTSSNWENDTELKVKAYATVAVPVYVIADREHGKVLVLSRPHEGAYENTTTYRPGDKVQIPGPLPCEISAETLLQG